MMNLQTLIKNKKLILVCGSGGVGKTTLSASLGLQAALMGKKVLVMTIDPARRLASSMGLESLRDKPQKISEQTIEKICGKKGIDFYAMMLNPKTTFDALVKKYAPTREIQRKILDNKIYQNLSQMIVGSQEYMAMEALYEIDTEKKYDLVVVDTPPTVHAIDFLDAPEKMMNAISHSMVHLLLKPALFAGRSSLKIVEQGSKIVVKIMDRLLGFAFLQEISEMLISFQHLLAGFQGRAAEVKKLLQDAGTTFILVSTCDRKSLQEVDIFLSKLQELKLPLAGMILNRFYPLFKKTDGQKQEDFERIQKLMGKDMAQKMVAVFAEFSNYALRDQKHYARMEKTLGPDRFVNTVPLFESDIHDLDGLYQLGNTLIV